MSPERTTQNRIPRSTNLTGVTKGDKDTEVSSVSVP